MTDCLTKLKGIRLPYYFPQPLEEYIDSFFFQENAYEKQYCLNHNFLFSFFFFFFLSLLSKIVNFSTEHFKQESN